MLFLNETEAAVVRHCDGSRAVAETVQAIGELYDDVTAGDVLRNWQILLRRLPAFTRFRGDEWDVGALS